MCKISLSISLFLIFSHISYAQNTFSILFTRYGNEVAGCMVEDSENDYIAVGVHHIGVIQPTKGAIWKISNKGDTLTKVFTFCDSSSSFCQILQHSNGNYIVLGRISSPPYLIDNLLILELDKNFDIVHQKVIELPGMEHMYGWGFKKQLKCYYLLSGSAGPNSTPADLGDPYFIKLDENFDTVCTYHIKLSGEQRIQDFIFSTDKSKILLFGQSYISLPWGEARNEMVIYDTRFNYMGYKLFPKDGLDDGYSDYMQGRWLTNNTFLMSCNYNEAYQTTTQQCFMEMDTSMNFYIRKIYGVPDTNDHGTLLSRTFDFVNTDSIYFTGVKNLIVSFWPNEVSWIRIGLLNRQLDPYYIRYYGGDAQYWIEGMMRTSDGGMLIMAIRLEDFTYTTSDWDMFFLKVNAEGVITVKLNPQICPFRPFVISPNPGSDYFEINLIIPQSTLIITDMSGSLLLKKEILNGRNRINCNTISPGMYMVTIKSNDGEIFTQKWIKQ